MGTVARGLVYAVLQVAAVYIYFLLFDQFGFLHHVQACLERPDRVQVVMAAMGVAGLICSFLAARLLRRFHAPHVLMMAWVACAAVALGSLACRSFLPLVLAGSLIGATTGAITVMVAATLADRIPTALLGTCVGLGTGLAYVCSNIPVLFEGGFAVQAGLAAGSSLVAGLSARALSVAPPPAAPPVMPCMPLWPWVVGLMALVWMDAGAFAMLQQDPQLKHWTWGPAEHKSVLALAHFLGAVGAGRLIDRGFRFSLVAGTWCLFAAAFSVIPHGPPDAFRASLLYAVGISTYSVLLVAAPTLVRVNATAPDRALRAAWIFGISGWIGSAMGVGMAQQEPWLPRGFVLIAGGVLIVMWLILAAPRYRAALPVFAKTAVGLALCLGWLHTVASVPPPGDTVQRGRDVYRREGCINCHSQYIRPRSPDVVNWGPYRPIDRNEMPPFVGNRRQGPDLKNAGLRRSQTWHRVHLQDPGQVSPGSRMPSYAHLFHGPGTQGEDLTAYVASLGQDYREAHLENYRSWQPHGMTKGSSERGARLFSRHCAVCHGSSGRGDGDAASAFQPPPRDLALGAYAAADLTHPQDPLALLLARTVKFGLPGTSMPGHELLTDADIVDLVHFVVGMQKANLR